MNSTLASTANQTEPRTGKIYLLYNESNYYIGSTFTELNKRFASHKTASKMQNSKLYQAMKLNNNFNIELLDTIETNDKKQLLLLEQKYVNQIKPNLNVNITIFNFTECYKDNKRLYNRLYYYTNKRQEYLKNHRVIIT